MKTLYNKDLILILTHNDNQKIVTEYNNLKEQLGDEYDIIIAYHQKETPPRIINTINHFCFTDELIKNIGLNCYYNTLMFGNELHPLFNFAKINLNYKNYWYLEDDVRFSGNWSLFFNEFKNNTADFLSCHIRWVKDFPNWPHSEIYNDTKNYNINQKIASFNPICRFSNKSMKYLISEMPKWTGHHECLICTLLFNNGYAIEDFSGEGDFTPVNHIDKFYNNTKSINYEVTNNPIYTFRWRDVFHSVGDIPNKLYHPVKDF